MYANYVRTATAKEVKIFEKVDNALTDELVELIQEEDLDDLLKYSIKNPEVVKAIEALGLTVKEVCIWYFID